MLWHGTQLLGRPQETGTGGTVYKLKEQNVEQQWAKEQFREQKQKTGKVAKTVTGTGAGTGTVTET